ncbi:MAG TPA: hypothetical protein VF584_15110 [Longimicrobium sp.]|jgi:hypothetical protein
MSHDIRRSRRLILLAAMMTLASGTAAAQSGANNRTVNGPVSGSPCDVLASGGTVFDTRECDLLRSSGVVRHGDQWTALAGRTLSLRLVSKDAKAVLGNVPVGVYRPGSGRTPVVQARTGADGTFRLGLPVGLTGQFHLLSMTGGDAAGPAEILVCDGNGNCFEFCELPAMPAPVLEPMCVEDAILAPILNVASSNGQMRR